MSSTVEKIKERLGIAEVVGTYIKLEKAGANFKGKCPFHNEKTPSFFVSPDRSSYYCFGCGVKGDIFTFVQEFERVDFIGSLKILAERAGVEIEKTDPNDRRSKSEKERLYEALEQTTIFFSSNLEKAPAVQEYLKNRGLKQETIVAWRLGYIPDEWSLLETHLKSKGFTDVEMEKAGLVKKGERGYYDRFRGRVLFPLFDPSGRVIGFSGRILKDKEGEAKYLNSPETELFNKSMILYGYHKAKNHIRLKGYSILVEGQMDLLMSQQAGYDNTVATSGTALTEKHLEILKRSSNKVMVVYDSDTAGLNASIRAWQTALSLGMEVKIAELPPGSDPADLILKDEALWRECLKNSSHIIDFYLSALVRKITDPRRLGIEIGVKVLPYVKALQSPIEQSHYISKISHQANIKEEALREELKRINADSVVINAKEPDPTRASIERPQAGLTMMERKILGIVLWQEDKKKAGDQKPEESIDTEALRIKLGEILGDEAFKELLSRSESIKNELIFEAEIAYSDHGALTQELQETLGNFEEDYLKEKLNQVMSKLSQAEKSQNKEEAGILLKQCQEISNKLSQMTERQEGGAKK